MCTGKKQPIHKVSILDQKAEAAEEMQPVANRNCAWGQGWAVVWLSLNGVC
jgi:hypothetical protein